MSREAYGSLFWGLLLVSVHLNLGPLRLFPPFFGWWVFYLGVKALARHTSPLILPWTPKLALAMALLSGIQQAWAMMGLDASSLVAFVLLSLLQIGELVLIFEVFSGFSRGLSELDRPEEAATVLRKGRWYLLLATLITAGSMVTITQNNGEGPVYLGLMMVVLKIWVLVWLRMMKTWDGEPSSEGGSFQEENMENRGGL